MTWTLFTFYLDYAKAFDKVDHQPLLSKLQLYGFHSKIIRWIESFLTNRSQQVIVDGHMSITAPIISGVPQGTVLGPILFLIFINDIASCVSHSTLRCFADDTRICRSISDLNNVHEFQSDLEEVAEWSAGNNMALHEDKFEYICHLANKHNPLHQLPFAHEHFQYTTSTGNILTPVDQLRDLGITVSKDLSWTSHIRSSCDKARKMVAWVFSVFHTRNTGVMLTLYKSLVCSHLEFCSPLWNPSKICDIQELESVQRTFTSKIHGLQHLHYWERLKTLTLMSLQRRRERYVFMHMWKILHGLTSNDLQVQFTENPRLGNLAKVPSFRKKISAAHQTLYETSFSVMGPKLWNCREHSPKAQQANTKYTREINSSKDYLVISYFALLLLNAYSILHLQCILAVNAFLVFLFFFSSNISFLTKTLHKITSNLNCNRVLK